MVANCTPCESSATISFSGHFVDSIRRLRSARSLSDALKWKGRIALSVATAAGSPARRPRAPAAAEVARTVRRFGDNEETVDIDHPPNEKGWHLRMDLKAPA